MRHACAAAADVGRKGKAAPEACRTLRRCFFLVCASAAEEEKAQCCSLCAPGIRSSLKSSAWWVLLGEFTCRRAGERASSVRVACEHSARRRRLPPVGAVRQCAVPNWHAAS